MQRGPDSNLTIIRRKEENNHQMHYTFGKTISLTISGSVVIDVYLIKGLYGQATRKNKAKKSKIHLGLQAIAIK